MVSERYPDLISQLPRPVGGEGEAVGLNIPAPGGTNINVVGRNPHTLPNQVYNNFFSSDIVSTVSERYPDLIPRLPRSVGGEDEAVGVSIPLPGGTRIGVVGGRKSLNKRQMPMAGWVVLMIKTQERY